jgi:hypothetical protein
VKKLRTFCSRLMLCQKSNISIGRQKLLLILGVKQSHFQLKETLSFKYILELVIHGREQI